LYRFLEGTLTYICRAPVQYGLTCSVGIMKSRAAYAPRSIFVSSGVVEGSFALSMRTLPDGFVRARADAPLVRVVVSVRLCTCPCVTVHPPSASNPSVSADVSASRRVSTSGEL